MSRPRKCTGLKYFPKKEKSLDLSSPVIPQVVPGFAYGGDFGDRPTDREFCVDGLVLPDRRNTPKMDAVKAAYAPLKITLTDTKAIVENRNLFTDLSAYDLVFASSVNGKQERRAVLRADCAPGKTVHIACPFALSEAGLACMTVTAVQRAVLPGIPAGYEAALGQVWHNHVAARLTAAAPELVAMDCNIGIKGEGFEYIFGRGKGLVSIRYNGVQLLDDTVRPNFWRAPTNNGKTSRHHPEHRVEVCWFARIPWRAAGTPPGRRFGIRMKEWVKKEEGVSFGETSEQQPTGYAAHSDHNSRCNPCIGEGVLLVVAQVLVGAGQFVGGVGGLCFGQTSDLLRGDACKQQEV